MNKARPVSAELVPLALKETLDALVPPVHEVRLVMMAALEPLVATVLMVCI